MSKDGRLIIVSLSISLLGITGADYVLNEEIRANEEMEVNEQVYSHNPVNDLNASNEADKGGGLRKYPPPDLTSKSNTIPNKKPHEMGSITLSNNIHESHSKEPVYYEKNIQLPGISLEQADEIIEFTSRDPDDTQITVHPDGTEQIDFLKGHATTSVAVIAPNGKLIIRHGTDFLQNVEQ